MTENNAENTTQETAASTAVAIPCLFGRKSGMTRVFAEDGSQLPVTIISLMEPTVVTQVKSKEKEGYVGVQLGFATKKAQRVNKAEKGHFKKSGHPGFYKIEEFRMPKVDGISVGATVSVDLLTPGAFVDVQGTTKGKGFQGVMKVWNFGGQPATHGHSVSHRSPGSIGNRADPGRVFPGKKMATHLGAVKQTTQNLRVVSYDVESKLLLIEGAVPGNRGGVVRITPAVKKAAKKKKA